MGENRFFEVCMFVGNASKVQAFIDRDESGHPLYLEDDFPITMHILCGSVASGLKAYLSLEVARKLSSDLADVVQDYQGMRKEGV